MSSVKKVAVVTGSNKGIGFAIVKGLCEKFNGDVYLTSRDVKRGQEAVSKLNALGHKPLFHQLDISDETSVNNFKEHIKQTHGGLDILINNAGVYASNDLPEGEKAEKDVAVNYFGTVRVCEALFPLLRQNAKVINVSSSAGLLQKIPSEAIRAKFKDAKTVEQLNELMREYIKDARDNTYQSKGWGVPPKVSYIVSKVGVNALTVIQQKLLDQEQPNRNISVNSAHPGFVDTDMTDHKGVLTVDQGAKSSLFLALEAQVKGKFVWYDCTIMDYDGPIPTA
ncbi:carbonyl reductase [NADPH] 3-like [Anthonomus grandis grandis]|uniref:carbonyl reductase [NADPH] 3-like n=1 Tax=Anthonomus grandis grandis TaxID=2921223 RepID=UPI002166B892|nr:carbonyl reductase [NADPH] 3-like [Anthonomus grandis grandis]